MSVDGLGYVRGLVDHEAVGVIHSDFQRGFIRAGIVFFADLMAVGSLAVGKVRFGGKDSIMQDGDVVEFRFNV